MTINFNASPAERILMRKIAKRAWAIKGISERYQDTTHLEVVLLATNANGCPLKLGDLLHADNFTFIHDVFGIHTHLDRETGRLKDCFLPRCAK